MAKRYQIFVSSTYHDLKAERRAVMEELNKGGYTVAGMELFPAANDDSWTLIQSVINDCDYYVLIVASRYGSIAPGEPKQSFTEREYHYAKSKGKPILAFVHERPEERPANTADIGPDAKKKQERLQKFRGDLNHNFCHWKTSEELVLAVARSVHRWVRDEEVRELEATVRQLERSLAGPQLPEGFVEFFGEQATCGTLKLVFCQRQLEGKDPFKYDDPRRVLKLPHEPLTATGVRAWLADEDVRVAVCCADFFHKYGRTVQPCLEGKELGDQWKYQPTIALGLGFTCHTRFLLERGWLDRFVQIVWPTGDDGNPTDAIIFNGNLYRQAENGRDYAIVARVVRDDRVHFICAGRTAPGTTAAGLYLMRHWEHLLKSSYNTYTGLSARTDSMAVLIDHKSEVDLNSLETDDMFIVARTPVDFIDGKRVDYRTRGAGTELLGEAILNVLGIRPVDVSPENRQRIRSQPNRKLLEHWLQQAARVASVEEMFLAPEKESYR